ncbi:MAG: glutathione peroxidase [Culicoidibacterales bacterium]
MSIYEYTVKKSNGQELAMSEYQGDVMLIVNTATKCGLAPQFKDLEALHVKYQADGLRVLGFPCSQFANQEVVNNDEIVATCQLNFGVTFPILAKIDVNGDAADPLFIFLKQATGSVFGQRLKWNFTKFLVGRDGTVVKRYAPTVSPLKIEKDIQKLLAEK